ncbi:bifunctional YncE family protein/alkaline phosphatase family protein [Mucilaginibacter sabulilitoris]|uniref:Bifunctional YncE family protein/alkaline phosphatase family protein n=1 Tax=Mucilaginibacter sabulilitoris TaxID=1173583 RepID=A0ABZ0TWE5_9SPHI|nr:bifunctional YncE family protein/alkaline phosphatase family protein [Mucilaginibacter sabulilitoris]WPU97086.1 bifunctional YncE family protein/alkaline phosphatase family protein [Mucilaginibacter sabulilitoris]
MKNITLVWIIALISLKAGAQNLADIEHSRISLPNGWGITAIGQHLPLGDLPLNMAVSKSKKYIAVTNNGQSKQTIQLINVNSGKQADEVEIPKSWGGIVFSADEKYLYASGGNDNWILKYAVQNDKLITTDTIKLGEPWPNKISPAGITIDDAKQLLYVVTKMDNALYVIDLKTKNIKQKLPLGTEAYTCLLSPNKNELYVSVWGGDKIMIYDTDKEKFTDSVNVGDNPNEICLSKNGRYLFVANANDNTVSVIDVQKRKVLETLNAALYSSTLSGSTTNGLALSADEKTLYIANADNNCLAVFDVSKPGFSKSKGFIPTGWYPTCVRVIGKKIYVSNGKGLSSMANPQGPNPISKKQSVVLHQGIESKTPVQYIASLFKGSLSIIDIPSAKLLATYSQAVYHNTPYSKTKELLTSGETGNPIPHKVGAPSPIKYVFYIIKENRTYDQVLGDIKGANGDTSLVLFGEKVTPNQHAIAKEFVTLDNFYVDGEVSSDGHNWSMGAYATDFLEKNWPTSYGRRGGGELSSGYNETANNKDGFIWDQASKYGVSYRTYGEFADHAKANIPVLKNHFCTYYPSFDFHVRDTTRINLWKREFDSLLTVHALPHLNTIRIGNNHTEGIATGRPTPFAHVADNDLAVGMFVNYLSKSPIWAESAVFIVEDDAQNGPDHVDAHRTTAFVAGGFVKRNYVDHTMYSTSSMLRTIELILGMPPLTQFDAAATPMWRSFDNKVNMQGFEVKPAQIDLNEKNTVKNRFSALSNKLDFSKEDVIPDQVLNEIIWKGVKGENSPLPSPTRAAFFKEVKTDKD